MSKKKKILYICQYFYPETFRGNDIAFHLASKGHEVHVVTGIPNYPKGKFYDGYGLFRRRLEDINGVKVTRLPIIPRGEGKVSLILNYFSYFIVSCFYILFHAITNKYDLVFCQQLSPIMMSSAAILYKRLRKVHLYTWVLDLWPESLTAAGGINNNLILSFFDRFVKSEYKWSDKILTSSKSFSYSILKYGDYAHKIIYYPQWGDAESQQANESLEVLHKIPEGFIVMFAGAVGEAHGFECNLNAALLTKDYPNIKWVIVGDGRKLEWVRQFVNEHKLNDTVITLGRYPAHTMPLFFAKADVMLVSLSDSPLFNLYAPAKISSYMAASKPIVACLNGEGRDVVNSADCGWSVEANDSQGLAELVINLSQLDSNILVAKGMNGRNYYDEHFEKNKCLTKLDNILDLN
jgi:glycosyltransferase involved in cell wall biosynthesis